MNPFVLACLLSAAQATTHHRFVSLKCDLKPRDTIQTIGYMTSTEEGAKTGLVLKSSSSIQFEVLLFPANKTVLLYSQKKNEEKKLIKTASHDLDGHNDFILDVIKGTDGYYFFFDDTFAGMVPTFQGPPPALIETTHDVNTTSLDVFSDCTKRHSPTGDKTWPLFLYDEVMEKLNSNRGCETREIHRETVRMKCDLKQRDIIQTIGTFTNLKEGGKAGLVLKSSSNILLEVLLFPANKTVRIYSQKPDEEKQLLHTTYAVFDRFVDDAFTITVVKGPDGYYIYVDYAFVAKILNFQGPRPYKVETTYDVETYYLSVSSACTKRHTPRQGKQYFLHLYNQLLEKQDVSKRPPAPPGTQPEYIWLICDLHASDVIVASGLFTTAEEGAKMGLVLKSSNSILFEVNLYASNNTIYLYSQKPNEEKKLIAHANGGPSFGKPPAFTIYVVKGSDGYHFYHETSYMGKVPNFQGPPPYIVETTYDVNTYYLSVSSACTIDHTPSQGEEYFQRLDKQLKKKQNASKRPPAPPGTHPEYIWMKCDLKTRDVIVASGLFTTAEEGAKMGLVLKSSNSILFEVNLYALNNTIYLYSQKPNEEKKLITHVDCGHSFGKPPAFTIYVVKGSDGYYFFRETSYMGKVPDFPGPPPFVVETTYDVETYNLEVLSDCTSGRTPLRDLSWARRLIDRVKDDEKAGYC